MHGTQEQTIGSHSKILGLLTATPGNRYVLQDEMIISKSFPVQALFGILGLSWHWIKWVVELKIELQEGPVPDGRNLLGIGLHLVHL